MTVDFNDKHRIDAFVFDAYGTLFDVQSVAKLAEQFFAGKGELLTQRWRIKQLEYSWLQSLMQSAAQPRKDFAAVTAHALDHACESLGVPLSNSVRTRLLAAYLHLDLFPDAKATLARLAPTPRVILSNGTLAMLQPLVNDAGLAPHIDAILSVDAAGVYKPAPRVYQLAADHLRLAPEHIGFVSSNCWDAIGAKAFGFTVFWVNRARAAPDRHGPQPDCTVDSLAELVPILVP